LEEADGDEELGDGEGVVGVELHGGWSVVVVRMRGFWL